jgi:hypothetical protein
MDAGVRFFVAALLRMTMVERIQNERQKQPNENKTFIFQVIYIYLTPCVPLSYQGEGEICL